ncbi:hypothetical protein Fmac_013427 [Flemingia macrophylla]|uniref:GATA-type domain-containing protein n=1 Tax=Flemingia macrophylla TaxID=520843 RepID=A0ABD1MT35_9FABA
MVDPTEKGSEGEESNPNVGNGNNEHKKTCADCGTTKTPLWRGGPAGPKVTQPLFLTQIAPRGLQLALDFTLLSSCGFAFLSQSLCNACGIRSRKKKRAILGISKGTGEDLRKGKRNNSAAAAGGAGGLKRDVLLHRSHWKKLGEEERAAVLLMSLSYGSVYA